MTLVLKVAAWVLGLAVGLVLLAALAVVLLVDSDWTEDLIERRVSARTGRAVAIGELEVDFGRRLRVVIEDFSIGNAPWGRAPQLAAFERLAVTLDLGQLLQGRTVLPELTVASPAISLERSADGAANWELPPSLVRRIVREVILPEDRTEMPILEHLEIADGTLGYLDPSRGIDLGGTLQALQGTGGGERLRVNGEGSLQEAPFRLAFSGGPFAVLRDASQPYPVDLEVTTAGLAVTLAGTVARPLELAGLDLTLELDSDDLADAFALAGITLPPTAPFHLSGDLARDGATWRLDAFESVLGDSDLAGNASIELDALPPVFALDAVAEQLDVADLAGLAGALRPAAQDHAGLIPDRPIKLAALRRANGTAMLEAKRILGTGLPIDGLRAELMLEDGVLRLQPVELGVFGGTVGLFVSLYGAAEDSETPTQIDTLAQIRDLRLKDALRDTEFVEKTAGRIDGRMELSGRGSSLHEMAATLEGEVDLVMDEGQISGLLVELIGLDVAEALVLEVGPDAAVPVRCLVVDLDVQGGVAEVETLVLDTTDTLITADGRIDLGRETVDLTVTPEPKDMSVLSLRSQIQVSGSWADLSVTPDVPSMLRFLPPIDLGTAEDAPCQEMIRRAREDPT